MLLLQLDAVRVAGLEVRDQHLAGDLVLPPGRENEIARKVLITHLQSGNSYGIQLKEKHCKFPQPELGPWVDGSRTVGGDYAPPVLEGWEPPLH